ncbi:hypothetical protein [Antrihabitans sp. YC2-6]|uniref:hypothetical protein n=1 Tax=Antrihabitans sp. YC2-6 TaxID=2799498 RepID=UPI0018F59D60|nr:hypothetical protein [Antrihabitans sp. YC2-6]MBJ8347001.1 hypothetical protein [Antrihabitans sp. YC2-6]
MATVLLGTLIVVSPALVGVVVQSVRSRRRARRLEYLRMRREAMLRHPSAQGRDTILSPLAAEAMLVRARVSGKLEQSAYRARMRELAETCSDHSNE